MTTLRRSDAPYAVYIGVMLTFLIAIIVASVLVGTRDAINHHNQRQHCERLHLAYIDGECRNIPTERPTN